MNLLSERPEKQTPGYWCTWSTQNFGRKEPEPIQLRDHEGPRSAMLARAWLNEEVLFGTAEQSGWVDFLPQARSDLFLLLDDGWDVSHDIERQRQEFGCMILSEENFPSFSGSPQEKLLRLNEKIKAAGWRGAGLWIACQEAPLYTESEGMEAYWRKRAQWCRYAGIEYWKIDWGTHEHDAAYRAKITQVAAEVYPALTVEHACPMGPFNGRQAGMPGSERFAAEKELCEAALQMAGEARVYRSYDVTAQLSVPTTLDRLSVLLAQPGGLVNCEDELSIGAALGCALGIMRAPTWNRLPGMDYMPYGQTRKMDEATRAVRWQRCAPAFAAGGLTVSEDCLTDRWLFAAGDSWVPECVGQTVRQTAPAVMARGMKLPAVQAAGGERPYVVCGKNPNGAVAVAALHRVDTAGRSFYMPEAEVTLHLDEMPPLIGIFGVYRSLRLCLPRLTENARVYAQDLLADEAQDITAAVKHEGKELLLPGELLQKIGLSHASPGDFSAPGLALAIRQ